VRTPILGKGRPYGVGDGAVGKSVGIWGPIGTYQVGKFL